MPGNTSFTHAIFKRLQGAYVAGFGTTDNGHFDNMNPMGGLCLLYPGHPNGILNKLGAGAPAGLPGKSPLAGTSNPADSPLWQMFMPSFGPPNSIPQNVPVGADMWPVMPPPEPPGSDMATQFDPLWLEFNNGNPPPLFTAFGNWIMNGKLNDYPQSGPLAQPGFYNTKPPVFPGSKAPLLFVASFAGDDGRRNGDGEVAPGVPLSHVPANFWATSQIFLYDDKGSYHDLQNVPSLNAGDEFYVCAVIGNSDATHSAGRALLQAYPINVICDAQCFNTTMSPAVPLPSTSNFDPADLNPVYEQYVFTSQSYEVAAFRFNVSKVFADLAAALQSVNIGSLTPAEWLKAGHPCVKVLVTAGEPLKPFPPMGNPPLTIISNPRYDRHIAQRNLAPFDMALMAIKKPIWTNFILSQAGAGTNGLLIRHAGWPADAVRFFFAMPRAPYERYVAPAGHRGFELVRDGVPKPFPDAVILRQTTAGAPLAVAEHDPGATRGRHGPDRFFGMAIGVEGDPARLRDHRLGDIEVTHTAHDRAGAADIVGGFSLRPIVRQG
jgi:hypothetical protein